MAVAVEVTETEPKDLEWLKIRDDAGGVTTYIKDTAALDPPTIHVTFEVHPAGVNLIFRAKVARNEQGEVLLRQDGAGLPDTIIVRKATATPPAPMIMAGWWEGLMVYRKEKSPGSSPE
jgi:hypothetical protein